MTQIKPKNIMKRNQLKHHILFDFVYMKCCVGLRELGRHEKLKCQNKLHNFMSGKLFHCTL